MRHCGRREGGGNGREEEEEEEVKRKRGYRMQLGKQFGLFSAVGGIMILFKEGFTGSEGNRRYGCALGARFK